MIKNVYVVLYLCEEPFLKRGAYCSAVGQEAYRRFRVGLFFYLRLG